MKRHIIELRNRILLLILCWISTFIVTYCYKEILLLTILKTTTKFFSVDFDSFIFTNVTELFTVYIKLGCFISNQFLCGYALINFLYFSAPGLYQQEYKILSFVIKLMILFWLLSFWVLRSFFGPIIWQFFLNLQETLTNKFFCIQFEAKIIEYLNFYINICYSCNLQSQFLVCLLIFFNYFDVNKNLVKIFRKVFYFIFLLASTILTPPDLISQVLVFVFLISFFEILVLLSLFFKNHKVLIR